MCLCLAGPSGHTEYIFFVYCQFMLACLQSSSSLSIASVACTLQTKQRGPTYINSGTLGIFITAFHHLNIPISSSWNTQTNRLKSWFSLVIWVSEAPSGGFSPFCCLTKQSAQNYLCTAQTTRRTIAKRSRDVTARTLSETSTNRKKTLKLQSNSKTIHSTYMCVCVDGNKGLGGTNVQFPWW